MTGAEVFEELRCLRDEVLGKLDGRREMWEKLRWLRGAGCSGVLRGKLITQHLLMQLALAIGSQMLTVIEVVGHGMPTSCKVTQQPLGTNFETK